MKARTIAYLFVLLMLIVFVLANWGVMMNPTELSVLVTKVHAPLGLIALAFAAAVFLIDLASHTASRLSWNRDRSLLMREMQALRARADSAEASRIQELKELVERETAALRSQLAELLASLTRS